MKAKAAPAMVFATATMIAMSGCSNGASEESDMSIVIGTYGMGSMSLELAHASAETSRSMDLKWSSASSRTGRRRYVRERGEVDFFYASG